MHFLAITGPTTSGKTSLSVEVARTLDAEIVCMDSRQVYRGMDIGTDKASREIRGRVPHHGLDTRDTNETYSAGQFGRDASVWISEIRARGCVPLVVG
ncbi:MAG: isopentenyl transferase family protein, partial [Longimicrobiales bacterium]